MMKNMKKSANMKTMIDTIRLWMVEIMMLKDEDDKDDNNEDKDD